MLRCHARAVATAAAIYSRRKTDRSFGHHNHNRHKEAFKYLYELFALLLGSHFKIRLAIVCKDNH